MDLSTVGVERAFTDNYLGTLQSDVVYAREDYIARAIAQSFFINPAGSQCPPSSGNVCPGSNNGQNAAPCQRNSVDSSGTNGNYNIVRCPGYSFSPTSPRASPYPHTPNTPTLAPPAVVRRPHQQPEEHERGL